MSYASQQYLIFDASSDANFRNWGSAISAAILNMGWVHTSDPQPNWATVTAPASSASFVSEFFQPGDGLTSFVVRVDYSVNTATPKGPYVRIAFASNSDGSGNLTGYTNLLDPGGAGPTGKGAVQKFDSYFSGDVNRLGMMLWRGAGQSASQSVPYIFCIERTKNTDGTDSNDGVNVISAANNNAFVGLDTLIFGLGFGAATTAANRGQIPTIVDGYGNASGEFNNQIPMFPVFPLYGKVGNPLTVMGFVHLPDVPEATFFKTKLYGSFHTYVGTQWQGGTFPGTNYRYCMRFD